MRRGVRASWCLGAAGLALAIVLLLLAQPATVLTLALRARPAWVLAAFSGTLAVTVLRGARLALLAGRAVAPGPATAVAAVSQLASGVLPLRLGELVMVPLLLAVGLPGAAGGFTVLVLARLLDVIAVLAWTAVAAALIGGNPVFALAALLVFAPSAVLAAVLAGRVLARVARPWRLRRGWRRRVLTQALRVRRAVAGAARSPGRAWGSLVCSLLLWGGIWGVTVLLLRGMSLDWPAASVLLGVVGAALGSSVPLSSLGTFGPQEAGWTGALVGAGVPARQALAAGFASHLWVLVFTIVLGLASAVYLLRVHPGSSASTRLASVRSVLTSRRGA